MESKTKIEKKIMPVNGISGNGHARQERIAVHKTYKLYIDGKFPRTESGRFYAVKDSKGDTIANACRASRKDLRDCIVSNRKASEGWSARSAYNKGQILYRIAETLEGRKAQFIDTMMKQGLPAKAAESELSSSVDLLVYYAGWTDKYIQVFSSVNPVESSHFNFSYPEATGVVIAFPAAKSPLLNLVASVAPAIAGGNTCTVLAAESYALTAIDFAEVIHASDVPSGVINILTGFMKELLATATSHMDVNAVIYNGSDLTDDQLKSSHVNSALNLKRMIDFSKDELLSPYRIMACQEIKTTWHPIGI